MENKEFLMEILNELSKEQLINLLLKKEEELNNLKDNKKIEVKFVKYNQVEELEKVKKQKGLLFPFGMPNIKPLGILNPPVVINPPYDFFNNNKNWC